VGSEKGAIQQPVLLVGGGQGTSGCFQPGATGTEVPVGSPILADREQA